MAAPVAAKLRRRRRQLDRLTRPEPVPGSYSIVSTMRESPEIVAAFVAHHLTTDADEVMIFLDEAQPEVQAMLATVPRCRVTVCDEDYWREKNGGIRPPRIVPRQLFNAENYRSTTKSEWLVHIDSDEFLILSGPLRPRLAAVEETINVLRIQNFERIMLRDSPPPAHIFEGQFRGRIESAAADPEAIFGQDAKFFGNGLSGYFRGKTITRVHSRKMMLLHPKQGVGARRTVDRAAGMLLHFDGFTQLHWVAKMIRQAAADQKGHPGRMAQMEFMSAATSGSEKMSLFQRINMLDHATLDKLAALGVLHDVPFDPMPAMRQAFPGREFDLSPKAFDRRMIAAKEDWFRSQDLLPE
jgi:hypothetical protein